MLAQKAMAPVADCTADKGHEIERFGTSLNSKAPPNRDQLADLAVVPSARSRPPRRLGTSVQAAACGRCTFRCPAWCPPAEVRHAAQRRRLPVKPLGNLET